MFDVSEHSTDWTIGEDGRRYPPRTQLDGTPNQASGRSRAQLAELAELINSGDVAREIDELVDDPDLAV
jgi:hypothetical protein